MSKFEEMKNQFGSVTFDGKEYALTDNADHTNRLLPSNYTNYIDASDGEDYDFEMSCSAIDEQGEEYTAYWIFTGTIGEQDPELDSYDYDDVDRVEVK